LSLTILDPDTALIVVDLQKGIVGLPFIHPHRWRDQPDPRSARCVSRTGTACSSGERSGPSARQAYEQGFNVTLAVDAMTDARSEAHAYCLTNVFPRLGETAQHKKSSTY
jgi:nicotinamidase-related amidase